MDLPSEPDGREVRQLGSSTGSDADDERRPLFVIHSYIRVRHLPRLCQDPFNQDVAPEDLLGRIRRCHLVRFIRNFAVLHQCK